MLTIADLEPRICEKSTHKEAIIRVRVTGREAYNLTISVQDLSTWPIKRLSIGLILILL